MCEAEDGGSDERSSLKGPAEGSVLREKKSRVGGESGSLITAAEPEDPAEGMTPETGTGTRAEELWRSGSVAVVVTPSSKLR